MPARLIEELTSRKQEKIATFLTFESIVAVLIGFMPLFMISSGWPLLVRVPACAGAAVAGYLMTVEVRGLPLYEQLIWSARGLFRLHMHGRRVVPEDLPGAIPAPDQDRVIAASGPIELVQRGAAARPTVATRLRPDIILAAADEPADADRTGEAAIFVTAEADEAAISDTDLVTTPGHALAQD
jgi:hypothetical protein